jgi:hypothetical protein
MSTSKGLAPLRTTLRCINKLAPVPPVMSTLKGLAPLQTPPGGINKLTPVPPMMSTSKGSNAPSDYSHW